MRCGDRRRKEIIGKEGGRESGEKRKSRGAEEPSVRKKREGSGVEKMENSPATSAGLENRRTSHSSIQPSGAMRDLF